jgi:hypothetical protein
LFIYTFKKGPPTQGNITKNSFTITKSKLKIRRKINEKQSLKPRKII